MSTYVRNSHCSYCGQAYPEGLPWPRQCASCGNITYVNPLPVSVVLVPVDEGLLLIRRKVAPHIGSLALPGGYINLGESWQAAGCREVWEETGIRLDPEGIRLFDVRSAPDGTVLIFGLASPLTGAALADFVPTEETSELVIGDEAMELAFPLHTQVANRFWQERVDATG